MTGVDRNQILSGYISNGQIKRLAKGHHAQVKKEPSFGLLSISPKSDARTSHLMFSFSSTFMLNLRIFAPPLLRDNRHRSRVSLALLFAAPWLNNETKKD